MAEEYDLTGTEVCETCGFLLTKQLSDCCKPPVVVEPEPEKEAVIEEVVEKVE